MTVKASHTLRLNIEALLARDHVTPAALAMACGGKDRSWMTRFLNQQRHELQLEDIEKIADFFGKQVYELFHPRTSTVTDRRVDKGDRRAGIERRKGHVKRDMLRLEAAISAHHPRQKGPYAVVASPLFEELAKLTADHEAKVHALFQKAESGGQTPAARRAIAGTRPRRRAVRRSNPVKD